MVIVFPIAYTIKCLMILCLWQQQQFEELFLYEYTVIDTINMRSTISDRFLLNVIEFVTRLHFLSTLTPLDRFVGLSFGARLTIINYDKFSVPSQIANSKTA